LGHLGQKYAKDTNQADRPSLAQVSISGRFGERDLSQASRGQMGQKYTSGGTNRNHSAETEKFPRQVWDIRAKSTRGT
ncbi:hypothetical protein KI387_023769, partial [Taxus chinensis]